ncbi:MAG: MFS transporter [Acidobacteria bacterium]|nr:MAG: MFS transporter [Acidobacteriota bacterium]
MGRSFYNYLLITLNYWGFTITDGALRMLVVLFFYESGYKPLEIALLFLFYEFFGIVTNFFGGWIGSRMGLKFTMYTGLLLQILACVMLAVNPHWLSIPFVMAAQAISGVAKDLNKMSAKAGIKLFTPGDSSSALFKWAAVLTGSKNALKGFGFFVGGFLLNALGFQKALYSMAGGLLLVFIITGVLLPGKWGKSKKKSKFKQLFSKTRSINLLSGARFFLFGSRDVWFVVGLPVFLEAVLHWEHVQVGSFMAVWVIGYGMVQALAPKLLWSPQGNKHPTGKTACKLVAILTVIPVMLACFVYSELALNTSVTAGLIVFGAVFALNSVVHSFLILDYSDHDKVAMNVGFYYMANAGGRLAGTVLSGLLYQIAGLAACLMASFGFLLLATFITSKLPEGEPTRPMIRQ